MELAVEPFVEYTGSSYGVPKTIERSYAQFFRGSGAIGFDKRFGQRSGQVTIIIDEPGETGTVDERSYVARIQDDIMDTFGLSMSDLADACKVARKTPYNWRDAGGGINRHKKGMDRLFLLTRAARDWKNSGFIKPGESLREQLVNGQSLYDLFLGDTIDVDAIHFLGSRLTLARLDSFDVNNPFESG